jgi:membrane protein implicated in regulation of membrane protease activity
MWSATTVDCPIVSAGMTLVAISAAYGAGGSHIGPAVAERLGVPFVDRAIPLGVADQLDVSYNDAVSYQERGRSWLERVLGGFLGGDTGVPTPLPAGTVTSEDFRRATEDVLLRQAATGKGVLLGRASVVVLREDPRALRVRLDGPGDRRIRAAMRLGNLDQETAERAMHHLDRVHADYAKALLRGRPGRCVALPPRARLDRDPVRRVRGADRRGGRGAGGRQACLSRPTPRAGGRGRRAVGVRALRDVDDRVPPGAAFDRPRPPLVRPLTPRRPRTGRPAGHEAYDFCMTALGISLLIIGAIVVVAEAHVQSLGLLGGPGVVALGIGTVLAVSGLGGGLILALATAVVLTAAVAGGLALSLGKGMAARSRRVRTGAEGMIGHVGVVQSWMEPTGKVLVDGALWHARRSLCDDDEDVVIHQGDRVVVERLSGLTLSVRPAEDWELIA